ncbi:putative glutamate receptor ionotropic, delta-1-like 44, partial [Homarus americanus]
MVKLVLEEVTAVHPSVRFYTIPVHHHPAARLSTLLSNTSWPWSGLVSLGGCRAQRVVASDVGLLEMPFLLVAWNTCYGLHLPSYNTVILNDVKFDNRFNCLTWVVSVWIKNSFLAAITPFNHFNVTHGGPQSF